MTAVSTKPEIDARPIKSNANRAPIDPIRMVLFPARAFLALGWLRAGVEKLIDPTWWTGEALRSFLDTHETSRLPFLDVADDLVGSRLSILLAFVVMVAEFGVGACMITTRRLPHALVVASALNIAFVAFGAVAPSAFYLVLQLTLLLALYVRRPHRSPRAEMAAIGVCAATAIAVAPFIRTIAPHAVIEDPAMMIATLASLTAATIAIYRSDRHHVAR